MKIANGTRKPPPRIEELIEMRKNGWKPKLPPAAEIEPEADASDLDDDSAQSLLTTITSTVRPLVVVGEPASTSIPSTLTTGRV